MVKLGMRTTVLPGMNIVELVLVLVAVEQESSLVR
jgi:hypothetical protein